MKNASKRLNSYFLFFFLSVFTLGVTGCSGDDDADEEEATGVIVAEDQTISGNTITVQSVTVGQDSWLVAVMAGDEGTNDFITDPVMVDEGTSTNIELTLNDDTTLMGGETGDEISLKLYADNPNGGTMGEWDPSDLPIFGTDGTLATETITVFMATPTFSDFDENEDGVLDADEVANAYQNDFTAWDTDGDGALNDEEFFNTTFGNTDADDDEMINQEEWDQGFASMYSNYVEDGDFGVFDADEDGELSNDEWNLGFTETEWFNTYDADASADVTEPEWDTGLFGDWDMDADGSIDEDEFNNFSVYSNNW